MGMQKFSAQLFLAATTTFLVAAPVQADSLPKPHIAKIWLSRYKDRGHYQVDEVVQPTPVITDDAARNLDPMGRIVFGLLGDGLAPDNEGHPGGFIGGYVHLYVRGIDASGSAGDWRRCDGGDCLVGGATSPGRILVILNPNFYMNQVGAKLQFRVWISWTPALVDDPSATLIRHSEWSDIFTVTRGHLAADAPRASAPPADPEAPAIDRVYPNPIEFGPGKPTDWVVTVTGSALCSPRLKIILNDQAQNPVPLLSACAGVQSRGNAGSNGEQQIRFQLPPALQKAGVWRLLLRNSAGDSGVGLIVVKQLTFNRAGAASAGTPLPVSGASPVTTSPGNQPALRLPQPKQPPKVSTPVPQPR